MDWGVGERVGCSVEKSPWRLQEDPELSESVTLSVLQ